MKSKTNIELNLPYVKARIISIYLLSIFHTNNAYIYELIPPFGFHANSAFSQINLQPLEAGYGGENWINWAVLAL